MKMLRWVFSFWIWVFWVWGWALGDYAIIWGWGLRHKHPHCLCLSLWSTRPNKKSCLSFTCKMRHRKSLQVHSHPLGHLLEDSSLFLRCWPELTGRYFLGLASLVQPGKHSINVFGCGPVKNTRDSRSEVAAVFTTLKAPLVHIKRNS